MSLVLLRIGNGFRTDAEFVVSHPSDKNKYVARVGHPVGCGFI